MIKRRSLGIKSSVESHQMMDQPLRNFIGWLMTEAAIADGEEVEYEPLLLPAPQPLLPSIRANPPAVLIQREESIAA